ncbi:hypothetical protein C8Q69DRAFT_480041 [Paecilomyces variotii]|uniref:FAD/NAD(P)-binding domain-containing protein n=1 Tax=Byssochlamys spectabilis TaxID=264951 RepID=A0A443HJX9_BYSSP|nr:hypothetical protein C8Q69DRAFT_480041 [Paecilomyces variotii]RWQ92161.1 hypothetical protein C8Q69DRAFT_480041 [Paecilomyces variotii]
MKRVSSKILALGSLAAVKTNHNPGCIVGVGPAGFSAAAQLEIKGYQTVTFEKQSAVRWK